MPSFKGFNNSQERLIMSFVPSLSGDHISREKRLLDTIDKFQTEKKVDLGFCGSRDWKKIDPNDPRSFNLGRHQ